MPKITKRVVDAMTVEGPRQFIWDSELKGFGVLALSGGVRSFVVQYRTAAGRKRRLTIGRYGALTVDQARKAAQDILSRVAKGDDPLAERKTHRTAPLMNDLFNQYLTEHVDVHNAPKTAETARSVLALHLRPRLGTIKVNGLTQADVSRVHAAMRATPRQANMALAILSKALSLAEIWGLRPGNSNPARGIARYPESHRKRFLSGEEVGRLGMALREAETIGLPWIVDETNPKAKHLAGLDNRRTLLSWQTVAALRLLLFTGARLGEVINLRWSDVDFKAGMIALPVKKGGPREPHPAPAIALELLATLPQTDDAAGGVPDEILWVFPRSGDPSRPITQRVLESAWARLRRHADFEDVHIHDLRHTFGTYAAQSGANAFAIRDVLRHANMAMTGRYANFDTDPVRATSNVVGARLAAALDGADAQVLPLKKVK